MSKDLHDSLKPALDAVMAETDAIPADQRELSAKIYEMKRALKAMEEKADKEERGVLKFHWRHWREAHPVTRPAGRPEAEQYWRCGGMEFRHMNDWDLRVLGIPALGSTTGADPQACVDRMRESYNELRAAMDELVK